MVVSSFSYTGISTRDLNPIYNVPMLGTHKSVVATADNAASSLRLGRLNSAVPHFKRWVKNQLAKTHVIAHASCMRTITATSARSDLYRIIDSAQSTHEPVQITGKRGNAVLVAEDDWRSIQETIYLLGIPGMRDSIIQGMAEDIDDCSEEFDL